AGMASPQRMPFSPEMISMAWQQRCPAGAGLQNVDNTCFLNAVLQCLTYTPPLANYLLSREHSRSCNQTGFCMVCTLEKHVRAVLNSPGSSILPNAIVSTLTLIGADFQVGRQQDTHEFLCYTLDTMSKREPAVIHQIFGGKLRSRVTCLQCGAVSDTYELFFDLPLDIKELSSVTGALEDFVRLEQLDGENSFQCSGCRRLAAVSKRLTIHHSSNILIVCLKRFDASSGAKINEVVEYAEHLDLGPYMSEEAEGPRIYSL
ncbi:UBP42 hydrolase, partial [Pterocles burchelli]|nr:UBP42 hydrolase [Pterocles burchelli]